jgi:hypothetical protein
MRAIYILSEGPTEEEFINQVLIHHFNKHNIYDIRAILMETSPGHKGGDVSYVRYKNNALRLLKQENDIIVTSLIDFFRLKTDFPFYNECNSIINKFEKISFLEEKIRQDINNHRFVPYIQLHEFEGLLFSSDSGFDYIPDISQANRNQLSQAVNQYPNPELLNDGPATAPSKRLQYLIPGYQKTFHGPLIAQEVTIETIIQKCERFRNWVELLIEKMSDN